MSHRTQITLSDEQYELLRSESRRRGVGLAELVRRAIDRSYASVDGDEQLAALEESFGAWGAAEDGAAVVERLRHGMAHRLSGNDG